MKKLNIHTELTVHYRDDGSDREEARTLLLFNGATLPLSFWDPVAERLARHYRVIRFDQRNAGETAFSGEFTLNDTAADAAAILDHLNIDSATLVGHAWGGRAAQVFARDYPHRVDAMIICGTGGQLPAKTDPDTLAELAAAAREGRRADWEAALAATFCAEGFRQRAPQRFQEISDLLWGRRPIGKARWNPQVSPSPSYWASSDAQTLLIYGREDKNGTPENAQHLLAALASARLEFVEEAGHFVVREAPDQVAALIESFLKHESAPEPTAEQGP